MLKKVLRFWELSRKVNIEKKGRNNSRFLRSNHIKKKAKDKSFHAFNLAML